MTYNWRHPLTRPDLRATRLFRSWLTAIWDKTESNEDRIEELEGRKPSLAHYGVQGTAASIAADADVNDFTGQDFTIGPHADVTVDRNAYFYHDTNGNGIVQYIFIGTRPRLVGIGGDGTTDADYQLVGTVDHGAMQGLEDDDHLQYFNQARGDARYYTETEMDQQQAIQDQNITNNAAKNVEQDNRLTVNEAKNAEQDGRLDDHDAQLIDRLRARVWADGATYPIHSLVGSNGWIAWSNKETTDDPVPALDPNAIYDMPDAPLWETVQFSGVVEAGREWTITSPMLVTGFDIWQPDRAASVNTVIRLYSYPVGHQDEVQYREIAEPILTPGAWTLVEAQRQVGGAGTVFGAVINTLNSGSDTLVTGGWLRGVNSNNLTLDPGDAVWGTNNASTSLRISVIDGDAQNRRTELMGMVPGTSILMTDTDAPQNNATWLVTEAPVDQGNHVSLDGLIYDLTGVNPPPIGSATTMTATVPVPSPTEYVRIIGGNPTHAWGSSRGLLGLDGVTQDAPNDAFGVRIRTQAYYPSPDWEIIQTP